jgi:hypothetical protein
MKDIGEIFIPIDKSEIICRNTNWDKFCRACTDVLWAQSLH